VASALDMLLSQNPEYMVQPRNTAVSTVLRPSPLLPETTAQLPEPSGMDAFWQRVGGATGGDVFGHVPFRAGYSKDPFTGKSQNSSPLMALLALASGYANAKARRGMKAGEEAKLFRKREQSAADARVKERNDAFTDARTKAAKVREERRTQMQKAIEKHRAAADAADARARSAGSPTVQANHIAARDAALAQASQVEADLAKLEGRAPKSQPAVPKIQAPAPKPARAAAAPKPAAAPKAKKLSEATQQTIDKMRRSGVKTFAEAVLFVQDPEMNFKLNRLGVDSTSVVEAFR